MDLCTCSRVSKVVEDHNNLLTQCTYDFTGFQTRTWEQLFIVYFKRPNIILGAHFSSLIFFENFNFWSALYSKNVHNFFQVRSIKQNTAKFTHLLIYMYIHVCTVWTVNDVFSQSIPFYRVDPYPFIECMDRLNKKNTDRIKTSLTVHTVRICVCYVRWLSWSATTLDILTCSGMHICMYIPTYNAHIQNHCNDDKYILHCM